MPIDIIGVPTGRAADGLALSSRNGYLTAEERPIAPELNKTIQACKEAILSGSTDFADLEASANKRLEAAGFKPDYFAIRDSSTLAEVTEQTKEIAILAAARLGATRLIDNTRLAPPK